jgi:DNA-binding LacI/PurR family transcriptional regulator
MEADRRMSSVRQIAAAAGVSIATVSRVLNNHPDVDPKTRDRILSALNRVKYTPRVGRRITNVVGVVYLGETARWSPAAFDAAVMTGIFRGVREQRYDVKIVDPTRDKLPDENYTQFFFRKGVRGVIIRTVETTRHVVEAIAAEGFPHIVIADRYESPMINYICAESRVESRHAIEHLIHLGHTRIGIAMHAVHDTDHRDRLDGYTDAMRIAGLPADPALTVEMLASMDGGVNAVTRLLALPDPPTAIFFGDPYATVGGLRRVLELGLRVPQEISIVGFDDSDIRLQTFPSFTAVCQDAEALGSDAALWLSRLLNKEVTGSLHKVNSTRLDVRSTTGLAPAKPIRILPDGSRAPVGRS